MTTLKHTTILRKGNSEPVKYFRTDPNKLDLHTGYTNTEKRQLWLSFSTSASGTGYTNYRINIGVEDYAAIINAMWDVNADAALKVMAREIAKCLSDVPHD